MRLCGQHSEPVDVRTTLPMSEVDRVLHAVPHSYLAIRLQVRVVREDDGYRVVGTVRPTRLQQAQALILPFFAVGAAVDIVGAMRGHGGVFDAVLRAGWVVLMVAMLVRSRDRTAARRALALLAAS